MNLSARVLEIAYGFSYSGASPDTEREQKTFIRHVIKKLQDIVDDVPRHKPDDQEYLQALEAWANIHCVARFMIKTGCIPVVYALTKTHPLVLKTLYNLLGHDNGKRAFLEIPGAMQQLLGFAPPHYGVHSSISLIQRLLVLPASCDMFVESGCLHTTEQLLTEAGNQEYAFRTICEMLCPVFCQRNQEVFDSGILDSVVLIAEYHDAASDVGYGVAPLLRLMSMFPPAGPLLTSSACSVVMRKFIGGRFLEPKTETIEALINMVDIGYPNVPLIQRVISKIQADDREDDEVIVDSLRLARRAHALPGINETLRTKDKLRMIALHITADTGVIVVEACKLLDCLVDQNVELQTWLCNDWNTLGAIGAFLSKRPTCWGVPQLVETLTQIPSGQDQVATPAWLTELFYAAQRSDVAWKVLSNVAARHAGVIAVHPNFQVNDEKAASLVSVVFDKALPPCHEDQTLKDFAKLVADGFHTDLANHTGDGGALREAAATLLHSNTGDVVFQPSGFTAHSRILAARCPYFATMLSETWGAGPKEVEFEWDNRILGLLLLYVYGAPTRWIMDHMETHAQVLQLLWSANRFCLDELQNACEYKLTTWVDTTNVVEFLAMLDGFNVPLLQCFCYHLIITQKVDYQTDCEEIVRLREKWY
jgi:hypothetical protein